MCPGQRAMAALSAHLTQAELPQKAAGPRSPASTWTDGSRTNDQGPAEHGIRQRGGTPTRRLRQFRHPCGDVCAGLPESCTRRWGTDGETCVLGLVDSYFSRMALWPDNSPPPAEQPPARCRQLPSGTRTQASSTRQTLTPVLTRRRQESRCRGDADRNVDLLGDGRPDVDVEIRCLDRQDQGVAGTALAAVACLVFLPPAGHREHG